MPLSNRTNPKMTRGKPALMSHLATLYQHGRTELDAYKKRCSLLDNRYYNSIYDKFPTSMAKVQSLKSKRSGLIPKVSIPAATAAVSTVHAFQTNYFLSRDPVFKFQAKQNGNPETERIVEQIISYQFAYSGMYGVIDSFLLDVLRYGAGVIMCYWKEISSIKTVPNLLTGKPTGAEPERVRTVDYAGNVLEHVTPYRFFWDTSLPLLEFQKGQFCGRERQYTEMDIVEGERLGVFKNTKAFLERAERWDPDFAGSIQDEVEARSSLSREDNLLAQTFQKMYAFGVGHTGRAGTIEEEGVRSYKVVQMYIRLVPSRWGLGPGRDPEVWVFYVDAGFNVMLLSEPAGHPHRRYPFVTGCYESGGSSLIGQGLMESVEGQQVAIDSYVNLHLRQLQEQANPSMLFNAKVFSAKDLTQESRPGKCIPTSPNAATATPGGMGRLSDHVLFVPSGLGDKSGMYFEGIQLARQNINELSGLSPESPGASSRQSATGARINAAMTANNLQSRSRLLAAESISPLAQQLLVNTQFQMTSDQLLEILGEETVKRLHESGQFERLFDKFDYVVLDSAAQQDQFASGRAMAELLQTVLQYPELYQQFDPSRLLEQVANMLGVSNPQQYRRTKDEGERLQQQLQQQAGQEAAAGGQPGVSGQAGTGGAVGGKAPGRSTPTASTATPESTLGPV